MWEKIAWAVSTPGRWTRERLPTMNPFREENLKTIRQQIIDCLVLKDMSANELSRAVGAREKDVVVHLSHIEKSMAAKGKTLVIRPFECLSCGYEFKERKRYSRPGRCPKCKGTHVENPIFRIL
ncbi:transcriptional regulator [Thermodesulfobacteriota bacterium]